MASIEVRGDAYRVVWRIGGRRGTKQYCTMPTDKLALAAKTLVESRRNQITDEEVYKAVLGIEDQPDPALLGPTFAEWLADWAKMLEDPQPDVAAGYRRQLEIMAVPFLGRMRLREIDSDVITAWIAWIKLQLSRRGTPYAPASVRRAHALLHQALGAAVPKWISSNPANRPPGTRRKTGLPKLIPHEAVFLDADESEILLANCHELIRVMVEVVLLTGLRMGEVIVLRIEDLNLKASPGTLSVNRALKNDGSIGRPKSKRSLRTITLTPHCVEILQKHIGERKRGYVFRTSTGLMWMKDNLRNRYWNKAVAAAQRCAEHPPPKPEKGKTGPARAWRDDEISECECPTRLHQTPRFHDLRHSHVAALIAAKWDPYKIQLRLGHDSIQTTYDIYGHLLGYGQADDLAALDALFRDEAA